MTEKRWRTVQPAHPSENVTVEQARAAWRKVYGLDSDTSGERGVGTGQSDGAREPRSPRKEG